ncbi:hypothetical protein GCM10009646_79690 [Streptomyces aureus]
MYSDRSAPTSSSVSSLIPVNCGNSTVPSPAIDYTHRYTAAHTTRQTTGLYLERDGGLAVRAAPAPHLEHRGAPAVPLVASLQAP